MIEFINVDKSYGNSPIRAVEGLCLQVRDGEIFGFLGPNGAGKTTTIKMLAGILPLSYGKILVNGFDITRESANAKQCMGYVPDNHLVYDKLTGREYINFLADIYNVGLHEREERANKLLDLLNLKKDFDSQISTYSHGMKQKISVIGALIHNPKLWLLDEPLTGLDPQSAFELKNLMREHVNQGNTVFFSTHILEVAEKICDRLAIIFKGRIIAVGTIDELKANKDGTLEEIFINMTSDKQILSNASYKSTEKSTTANRPSLEDLNQTPVNKPDLSQNQKTDEAAVKPTDATKSSEIGLDETAVKPTDTAKSSEIDEVDDGLITLDSSAAPKVNDDTESDKN